MGMHVIDQVLKCKYMCSIQIAYRIFSNRSLPRINAGLVLKPGVRQRLKTINAGSQIEAGCLRGGVAPIARADYRGAWS
jgi:hypothetical protein